MIKYFDKITSFHILMPLIMLLGVTLVFLPFGFNLIGFIEEWGVFDVLKDHGPLYFLTKNTPIATHRMRPLAFLPFSIGHQLDPNSFFYWNILQFLFIWLKGVAVGAILWWLYPQRWIAILGGLLFILYPADTQQLSLRILSINSSVAALVGAIACVLWAARFKDLWVRIVLACSAGVLFLCACFMYEAAFLLAPMPLLLWWAKYGMRDGWRFLKSQKLIIFFWLAAILIEAGYLFWVGGDPDIYQKDVSNNLGNTLKLIFKQAPLLVTVGFYRTFLHSWYDAARMLLTGGDWIVFLPIAVVPILLLVLCLCVKDSNSDKNESWFFIRWLVASAFIIILGYLPFLSFPGYYMTTQRTYLFAGIGGALICTGLIAAFRMRFRWVGAGMASGLLLLGVTAQWTQFTHYNAIAGKMKTILSGILESAPRLDPKQNLLIIDRTGSLGHTMMLRGELLKGALNCLYGKSTPQIAICLEPGLLWSSFNLGKFNHMGRCEEQQDAWQIGQGLPGAFTLPKKQLVTLIIEKDGQVHPHTTNPAIPPATSSEQARWIKFLGCWPAKACRIKSQPTTLPDHFTFNFSQWWDLEEPIPGAGWGASQWGLPAWQPRSFAWIIEPKSTLLFYLDPRPEPYLMELGLAHIISEQTKQDMKIFLNDHAIKYNWLDEMHAQAKIDPAWLIEGVNELLFLTDIDPSQGVSLGVEYVKVLPHH